MTVVNRLLLVISVLAVCILIDQITKEVAGITLSPLVSTAYLNGFIRFIYAENTGILLSIGVSLSDSMKFWLFTLSPSLLLLGLLLYILIREELSRLTLISCSMIIGGGVSNIIDRLTNDGAVVDFMYLDLWGLPTGIFNIADVAISAGSVALIILTLTGRTKVSPDHFKKHRLG